MGFAHFLTSLLETGTPAVSSPTEVSAREVEAAKSYLHDFEKPYRTEMPGQAPALDIEAAAWAACILYRCCQFSLYRNEPAERIEQALAGPRPDPASPSVCYSVDLTFRFLPGLYQIARYAAEDDPLTHYLWEACQIWGLSSVGVGDLGPIDIRGVLTDRCLMTLYVDRIIETQDGSRLADPVVRSAVLAAFGSNGIPASPFGRKLLATT